ncbi:MAG: hypothetical protein ACREB2_11380, partial [Pseudolabrys sp.]
MSAAEQPSEAASHPTQNFRTEDAWNRTPHTRVVLFVDFRKPLRFPANFLNWLLLSLAVFTPFIREGADNQRAWE